MTKKPNESKRALINNLCPSLRYSDAEIESLIITLDREGSFDAPPGELSFAFVSKEEISKLHHNFMGDPSPTDVITFPGDPDIEQAGEVCVCPDVAHEFAKANNLEFSQELALYLIHGYLHLCGFDDIDDADRAEMRLAEQRALTIAKDRKVMPAFELH